MTTYSRVDPADGQKQVFECWKLFIVPDRQKIISGTKVLGIEFQAWDHVKGSVSAVSLVKTQPELAELYQTAIASHEASNQRSLPSRIVRGRGQSYEQDLETRCSKLPPQLKDSIRDLLLERGYASSTTHHQRTWTVVFMEERWVHRFTRAQGAKVDRHKVRFWKNPKTQQMTECFVVIRGGETGTPDAKTGYTRPNVFSNPWADADFRENSRMLRQERAQDRIERTRRRARSISRSRDRSRHRWFDSDAAPPSRDRRQTMRDRSSDSSEDDNYHWRREPDEFDFDEFDCEIADPEFRSRPRFCPPLPRVTRCFPPAPTPPRSFPPPPAVAAFHRQGLAVPPPPPPPFPVEWPLTPAPENPFIPRPPNVFRAAPYPPIAWNGIPPPPPPQELDMGCSWTPMPLPPPPPPPLGRLKSLCLGCKVTPNCPHFPGSMCYRPVRYAPETLIGHAHYDCLDCLEGPRIWRRPAPRCDDADDTATVLDDDDVASEHDGDGNSQKVLEANEDDEDTQVEELAEMPATAEGKKD